ncbi:malto-oligosyltrehalose trehalohydrolase [Microbacteriaceae bacterium K1510]|nr:malto-oligosyltrehalose trehalohydrolase [Microbacteriaceae bacterium K1510]
MTRRPQFGPLIDANGVTFRLWAPAARNVSLMLDTPHEMERHGDWFMLHRPDARPGARYRFKIDGELEIPDPGSHFQPEDVHGPSEIIDHRYDWQCTRWKGRPWHETVFLEVHIGAFTQQGTFSAAIGKLDHLTATGITALELMPLADFPGRWNWGYDGALLFAPDATYGRPEDLKALIDAAHARGLMVFLDVVYNHFGPEGNYLHRIAPAFFCDAHTPWGGAIDYERLEVRAFAIENALHWLDHYRVDGLRLDAVHAIVAPGEPSILHDLSTAVGQLAADSGRHIHLVLENDNNIARLLAPQEDPPAGRYRAQWNDDYHHAWHVLLTHEKQGYYRDYRAPKEQIERVLADGFAYQGEASPHRDDEPRGEPSRDLPRAAFVNFLQNHDQIGNRPLGERLTTLAESAALEAALAVLLLQPSPPLLFMGEEWGATEPFPFFCDFKNDLADAVREGRKREFAEAYAKHSDEIPDPLAAETYQRAKLDWQALAQPAHGRRLALTRALLEARQRHIVPLLPAITEAGEASRFEHVLSARWAAGKKTLMLLANLSDAMQSCPDIPWGAAIWGGTPAAQLAAWSVYAAVGDP